MVARFQSRVPAPQSAPQGRAVIRNTVSFRFSAAHRLPHYEAMCNKLHGHNYDLAVTVEGPVDPASGMLVDFVALQQLVENKVTRRCDKGLLNDILENPTAENLVRWIWDELKPGLPALTEITLTETGRFTSVYRGEVAE
jgi:6-pyruvoyltetrahydropterin/6-carboxytetrahydropterin synthase